jgi:hypothetical protein
LLSLRLRLARQSHRSPQGLVERQPLRKLPEQLAQAIGKGRMGV